MSKRYIINENWKKDYHSPKIQEKNQELGLKDLLKEKAYSDYGTWEISSTISTKVDWMNNSRANTKLSLRNNFGIKPYYQEVWLALKNNKFSLVPKKPQLPMPMQNSLAFAA